MRIFVFLAEGFEEIEAIVPIDIFRRAEIETVTVSISNEKVVRGAHNISVLADKLFDETYFSGMDLLFLPGGMPGTSNLDAHKGLKKLIQNQFDNNKNIAAICAAPSILGKMNLLNEKEAICYPGFEDKLYGAKLSNDKVVKSGNITTAKGAGVALQFALKLVEALKGREAADKIAEAIMM